MNNAFRDPVTGNLDRVYMRTCAIFRLLKNGHIDKDKAIEMAPKIQNTIEIWLKGPLKAQNG